MLYGRHYFNTVHTHLVFLHRTSLKEHPKLGECWGWKGVLGSLLREFGEEPSSRSISSLKSSTWGLWIYLPQHLRCEEILLITVRATEVVEVVVMRILWFFGFLPWLFLYASPSAPLQHLNHSSCNSSPTCPHGAIPVPGFPSVSRPSFSVGTTCHTEARKCLCGGFVVMSL